MQLSPVERLILRNQLEILKRLDGPSEAYDEEIEILERGYEIFYGELFGDLNLEGVPESVSREVLDVLDLHRAIDDARRRGLAVLGYADFAAFQGFDANTEHQHYAFARFLTDTQGKYQESGPAKNAHRPMLAHYRGMIERWGRCGRAYPLDQDQLTSILS